MPPALFVSLLAASLCLCPAVGFANRALARTPSPYRGLILPSFLALGVYTAFILIAHRYSLPIGFLVLALGNLPLLVSLVVYLTVRVKRHNTLYAAYQSAEKAKKPPINASAKLREALEGFSCPSPLSLESQHEVVILLKAGSAPDKVAAVYDCAPADITRIEKAFDRYRAEKKRESGGEPYTVSHEQAAFFLQLMTHSTPKSLGCGDGLLWSAKSVRRLIFKATKTDPSDKSVAAFLSAFSLTPKEEDLAAVKTPAALVWCDTEYRKIRLSALENAASLYWVYTLTPSNTALGRKTRVLYAVGADNTAVFGIYKGSGGFSDFLNKLAQERTGRLYAVVCSDFKGDKHLDAINPDVTLFAFGEKASLPTLE